MNSHYFHFGYLKGKSYFAARAFAILAMACFVFGCAKPQGLLLSEHRTKKDISDIHLEIGTNALINGDSTRAVENLRKSVELNRENFTAYNHLGLAYMNLGEAEKARESFLKAVQIQPEYSDGYINLAGWYFSRGDTTTARHYYKKALSNLEYHDRYRALTGLGQLEFSVGHEEEAKKLLLQSLDDNKEYCLTHLLLGNIFTREGNSNRAQASFKNSVKGTCANNIDGQYQLAMSYLRLKEYKKARTQLMQVVEQFPNTAMAEKANEQLRAIP